MTLTDSEAALSAADNNALGRAIEICRRKDPAAREQIEHKLATELWRGAAEFAAYSCQCDALHLQPWQDPPCWVDDLVGAINAGNDGILGDYAAAKLLRQLLDRGLSRYEPDPVNALKQTKRRVR
jgi:hypothetical protein